MITSGSIRHYLKIFEYHEIFWYQEVFGSMIPIHSRNFNKILPFLAVFSTSLLARQTYGSDKRHARRLRKQYSVIRNWMSHLQRTSSPERLERYHTVGDMIILFISQIFERVGFFI